MLRYPSASSLHRDPTTCGMPFGEPDRNPGYHSSDNQLLSQHSKKKSTGDPHPIHETWCLSIPKLLSIPAYPPPPPPPSIDNFQELSNHRSARYRQKSPRTLSNPIPVDSDRTHLRLSPSGERQNKKSIAIPRNQVNTNPTILNPTLAYYPPFPSNPTHLLRKERKITRRKRKAAQSSKPRLEDRYPQPHHILNHGHVYHTSPVTQP